MDRQKSGFGRPLQGRKRLPSTRYTLLRHLFPQLQPSETRLLRRKPDQETWYPSTFNSRCHRRHACGVSNYTMRCHQDAIAGRSAERRNEVHIPKAMCTHRLQRGGFQGVLQGWTCTCAKILSPIWLYAGWV